MKRVFAYLLTLCLMLSLAPAAYAQEPALAPWQRAYQELILSEDRTEEWNASNCGDASKLYSYSLYDMDGDGVPELFMHFGTHEADEHGKLYTFRSGKVRLLKEFAYGYNYFATYPEEDGVLFRHIRWGQIASVWTIDGSAIAESEPIFREEDFADTELEDIVPGAVRLTEFPSYTLLPLLQYEQWAPRTAPLAGGADANVGANYPENDSRFFEKVVEGQTLVAPTFVARTFDDWFREYFSWIEPAADLLTYEQLEARLLWARINDGVKEPPEAKLADRKIDYADLNEDGQLEAVCTSFYLIEDTYSQVFTVILCEEEGTVYAHCLAHLYDAESTIEIDQNNNFLRSETQLGFVYKDVFRLCFDKGESFLYYVPTENFGAAALPENGDSPFSALTVGDTVVFGRYEQDNDLSNGQEDISWLVLAREDGRMLLISELALDCQPYDTGKNRAATWDTCTLRRWLNDGFLKEAFSDADLAYILPTTVAADKNPKHDTAPGDSTQDQVFLLSIKELTQYFSADRNRRCEATPFAIAAGARRDKELGTCWWWTRSPGAGPVYATDVRPGGAFNYYGSDADREYLCVRPALWIDLSA